MRVDFEDGHYAEIYSVGEMPRRVTARLADMLAETPDEQSGFAAIRDIARMRDTLMTMVIIRWSYDFDRTGDSPEDMYNLPEASYDALKKATSDHWRKAGFIELDSKEKEGETKPAAKKKTPASSTSSA
jgi:hypothetical protein